MISFALDTVGVVVLSLTAFRTSDVSAKKENKNG